MQDTASHAATQLDNGEQRHALSVHDVGAALVAAGVPRSHRQIIRYCETAMVDAVILVGALSVWRRGRRRLALSALFMPVIWLLMSAAAYRALWQLVRDPYLWEKTEHGVDRP